MLGMVGGVMGLLFSFFNYFMHPLSSLEFVIDNQSAREEINLVIKQGLCQHSAKKASVEYGKAMKKREKFIKNKCKLYIF